MAFAFRPQWVAIGAIEPRVHAPLPEKRGIGDSAFAPQWDQSKWPGLREKLARSSTDYQRNEFGWRPAMDAASMGKGSCGRR